MNKYIKVTLPNGKWVITESGHEKLFDYPLDIENFIIRK